MINSKKHLVLVGGGHAHMLTLTLIPKFIQCGIRVTVIGPSDYHYYSGMGPGMLGGTYTPDEIRFGTRVMVKQGGGVFVKGKTVGVDLNKKEVLLESGERLPYDVISFNAGSHVPQTIVKNGARDIYPIKPIGGLIEARDRILKIARVQPPLIGIIGGGPSSAEIAGNAWQLLKDHGKKPSKIFILAGNRFMARFPDSLRSKVHHSLAARGIEVLEGCRVREVDSGRIISDDGRRLTADLFFLALGVKPSPMFQESGLATGPDGGLLVNQYLQSVDNQDIFGGGDCIHFQDRPLDKVGVYAVRQNPILFHNLMARLTGEDLLPFNPGHDYLMVFNLGCGKGVLKKNRVELSGRLAFQIKNFIDQRFIKKFQKLEKQT